MPIVISAGPRGRAETIVEVVGKVGAGLQADGLAVAPKSAVAPGTYQVRQASMALAKRGITLQVRRALRDIGVDSGGADVGRRRRTSSGAPERGAESPR